MAIHLPTVSIGIPTYNEQENIARLIKEILCQTQKNYYLKQIIIVLDGSIDSSFQVVKTFNDSRIKIIKSLIRKGKPARINQIIKTAQTDVLITLDADIHLKNLDTIDSLVSPFLTTGVALTSGLAIPSRPKNMIQEIALSGVNIWDYARKITQNSAMYYTEGQIRAYEKSLYKKLTFPNTSADDVYPYIYSQLNNLTFTYCPMALAIYELPLRFSDYIKQQTRYLQSPLIQQKHFGPEVVKRYFTISFYSRIRALLNELFVRPLPTLLYLIVWTLVKIQLSLTKNNFTSIWDILYSTKKINYEKM